MNKEILNKAYTEIDNFRDKLGEVFFDAVMEEDNTTYEMAKSIIAVFDSCETEEQFKIADGMLTAICGWKFETLVSQINERDEAGYTWKSC